VTGGSSGISHRQGFGRLDVLMTALFPAFVDTPMTDFIKGQVKAQDMIQVSDIAETVRVLPKMSPGCVVPEIQFVRPGERL
jgi:hypothetical protein